MKASDIIALFGGPTRLSELLDMPLSTVHRWSRANFIPEWRQGKLLEIAAQKGIALATTDFPSVDERISLTKAAACTRPDPLAGRGEAARTSPQVSGGA